MVIERLKAISKPGASALRLMDQRERQRPVPSDSFETSSS
jgi:hypothetical protein